jgi:mannose-1-phosphate guanylyltransferase/phosphomannomutase
VIEAAGDKEIDTTEGVCVMNSYHDWVLVLPDPFDAVTNLWAEGNDADAAQDLLDKWSAVVENAGRA